MADLLDVPGVAARLDVSVRHVRSLVRHQRIPHVRHGHRVLFDPRRIDAWLATKARTQAHRDDGAGSAAAVAGEEAT